jgi:peptide/nickel transport system substrate-binding protein
MVFGRCWGETLMEMNGDGGLECRLAEEVGASKDAKAWTIKIRKGILFHSGRELTSHDVAATLERHSNRQSQSNAFSILQAIESLRVDGSNVVIQLKRPNVDLPYLMTDPHLIIQPNGGNDDPGAGIATGPYKVVVNEFGVRHGGEKFKDYWQGDKLGQAEQVEIIVINDSAARVSALQSIQVHMIDRVEPKFVDLLRRVPGVTIQNIAGRGCYYLNMFCDTAPFDNNDLRMALSSPWTVGKCWTRSCAVMGR